MLGYRQVSTHFRNSHFDYNVVFYIISKVSYKAISGKSTEDEVFGLKPAA